MVVPFFKERLTMRAEIIHVTDHALLRWKERASVHSDATVHDVIKAVKESRQIKYDEPLPYQMPRKANSVYTINRDGVLFVLETVEINEFRLITVITPSLNGDKPQPFPKGKKRNHGNCPRARLERQKNAIEEDEEISELPQKQRWRQLCLKEIQEQLEI